MIKKIDSRGFSGLKDLTSDISDIDTLILSDKEKNKDKVPAADLNDAAERNKKRDSLFDCIKLSLGLFFIIFSQGFRYVNYRYFVLFASIIILAGTLYWFKDFLQTKIKLYEKDSLVYSFIGFVKFGLCSLAVSEIILILNIWLEDGNGKPKDITNTLVGLFISAVLFRIFLSIQRYAEKNEKSGREISLTVRILSYLIFFAFIFFLNLSSSYGNYYKVHYGYLFLLIFITVISYWVIERLQKKSQLKGILGFIKPTLCFIGISFLCYCLSYRHDSLLHGTIVLAVSAGSYFWINRWMKESKKLET